ncbi:hypothetical protein [Paenibacillus methanolicus]|uniref:Uncharacterized protein n=1 Tax=Paenibacillus methanolicus TaxID=582686 RepID=A0A5S5CGS9_9BACL|nr:hypothetical protein [Paenibacillus methanolicus]TYP78922.1 hypothetical protein BCM02_10137 [Paenibacillus methanolicus]
MRTRMMQIPIKQVLIEEDSFWGRRQTLVRETVIPFQWQALNDEIPGAEPSRTVENFRIAAGSRGSRACSRAAYRRRACGSRLVLV